MTHGASRIAATRRFSMVAMPWIAYLGLSDCGPVPSRVSAAPIRIGTYLWPGRYWIEVAWTKGWFREAGLNVERINLDRKYFASLNDVASGKLDAMGFSQFDLVRHVAAPGGV